MRRVTDIRYIPYLRIRCRRRVNWRVPSRSHIRESFLFLKCFVVVICFALTFCGTLKNLSSLAHNAARKQMTQWVYDDIDRGLAETVSLFPGEQFISINHTRDGSVISIENNRMAAEQFAACLSENIRQILLTQDDLKIKIPLHSASGKILSLLPEITVPCRAVVKRIMVKPVFSMDELKNHRNEHCLIMEIFVQVKVFITPLSFTEEINKTIPISELIISSDKTYVITQKIY